MCAAVHMTVRVHVQLVRAPIFVRYLDVVVHIILRSARSSSETVEVSIFALSQLSQFAPATKNISGQYTM